MLVSKKTCLLALALLAAPGVGDAAFDIHVCVKQNGNGVTGATVKCYDDDNQRFGRGDFMVQGTTTQVDGCITLQAPTTKSGGSNWDSTSVLPDVKCYVDQSCASGNSGNPVANYDMINALNLNDIVLPDTSVAIDIKVCVEKGDDPVVGSTVRCYDKDTGTDDFVGSGNTDATGCVTVPATSSCPWDSSSGPDIYCQASGGGIPGTLTTSTVDDVSGNYKDMGTLGVPKIDLCANKPDGTLPLVGATVVCWDEDDLTADDFMAAGVTGNDGCVSLFYERKGWDLISPNPDIFCEIAGPADSTGTNCFFKTTTTLNNQDQTVVADFGDVTVDAGSSCTNSNGCGGIVLPTSIGIFLPSGFEDACDAHDLCYTTCERKRTFVCNGDPPGARSECDAALEAGLLQECNSLGTVAKFFCDLSVDLITTLIEGELGEYKCLLDRATCTDGGQDLCE